MNNYIVMDTIVIFVLLIFSAFNISALISVGNRLRKYDIALHLQSRLLVKMFDMINRPKGE